MIPTMMAFTICAPVVAQPEPVPDILTLLGVSDVDPNRDLTAEEAERLVGLVVVLLDRDRQGSRIPAIEALGMRLRHRAAASALRRVMRDEDDDATVRIHAAEKLLLITPNGIGDIIPLLRSEVRDVSGNIHSILCSQYPDGREYGFSWRKPEEEREAAIPRWEKWWEENREGFEINIINLLMDDD